MEELKHKTTTKTKLSDTGTLGRKVRGLLCTSDPIWLPYISKTNRKKFTFKNFYLTKSSTHAFNECVILELGTGT